jgi:hypothetical protein
MATKNDITGDALVSRNATKAYLDNRIAQFKAGQDGIAQALAVDDSRFEPTYRRGDPVKGGKVVVEI